jgi:hypothetical protein
MRFVQTLSDHPQNLKCKSRIHQWEFCHAITLPPFSQHIFQVNTVAKTIRNSVIDLSKDTDLKQPVSLFDVSLYAYDCYEAIIDIILF